MTEQPGMIGSARDALKEALERWDHYLSEWWEHYAERNISQADLATPGSLSSDLEAEMNRESSRITTICAEFSLGPTTHLPLSERIGSARDALKEALTAWDDLTLACEIAKVFPIVSARVQRERIAAIRAEFDL